MDKPIFETSHKYDDIIHMPHHVSTKHPRMSIENRAAQFAPFAALTGYEDAVKETAREVDTRIEIDEEQKNILDSKIQMIIEQLTNRPVVTFTYFIPDLTKDGGEYISVAGIVKKFDTYNQTILLEDDTEIPVNEVIDISGEIFKMYE